MNETNFKELLEKYISGKLDPSEKSLLAEAIDNPGYQAILEEMLRESYAYSAAHPIWTAARRTAFVDSLLQRVRTAEAPAAPAAPASIAAPAVPFLLSSPAVPARDRRFGPRHWLAAAAVFIILATGVWLLYKPPAASTAAGEGTAGMLLPGGSKAILVLGDGSRIVLDSAADGRLAEQGGAAIVKLADGKIAYQASGHTDEKILYNMMATPRGGEYQLILPDGTKVWLNSASSIRYPNRFTGDRRAVEVSGEAYFEVAKDEAKPFIVKAADMQVQVLGTAFDLMAYPDEDAVRTTLVQGVVKVMKNNASRILKPEQQASLPSGGNDFILSEPDMRVALAWKEGRFRFAGARITTIMRQIARWYDVEIEYSGVPPVNEFDGSLSRRSDASQLLKALERTGNVHFNIEGKKIIVLAGAR